MDIHQLETFLDVVDEKGFSRAAKRLHRTQPAVSQVVRKLEEDLGETLFERTARDGTLGSAVRLRPPDARFTSGGNKRDGGAQIAE